MTKWPELPQEEGKIKLKPRPYTLLDAFNILIDAKDPLIKYLSEEEMFSLTKKSEFDSVQPYVPVKIFKTEQDKKDNKYHYFVFANHGPIYFCDGEVLERYKLEDINYFWNFVLSQFKTQPKEFIYYHYFTFSEDDDAITDWVASLNFEDIFATFGLNGADGGYAGFVGLFIQS